MTKFFRYSNTLYSMKHYGFHHNGYGDPSSNLDGAVSISIFSNILDKSMNPTIPPPANNMADCVL